MNLRCAAAAAATASSQLMLFKATRLRSQGVMRGGEGDLGEMQSSSGAQNTSTQKEVKLSRADFNILLDETLQTSCLCREKRPE